MEVELSLAPNRITRNVVSRGFFTDQGLCSRTITGVYFFPPKLARFKQDWFSFLSVSPWAHLDVDFTENYHSARTHNERVSVLSLSDRIFSSMCRMHVQEPLVTLVLLAFCSPVFHVSSCLLTKRYRDDIFRCMYTKWFWIELFFLRFRAESFQKAESSSV